MRPAVIALVVCLLGGASWTTTVALAQPMEISVELRRDFEEASRLYEERSYARAEAAFRRIHEQMADHPKRSLILFNVGRAVEAQPGREADAIAVYEQMLRDSEAVLSHEGVPDARSTAEERVAELRARIAARDGVEGTPASPAPAISPVGPIFLGVGAAMLLSGSITGGLALAQRSDVVSRCEGTRCPPDARAQASDIEALAIATDVLLFGGAAVAVAGLVLTLLLKEAGADDARAAATCGPAGCVAMVEGSFE